MRRWVRGVDCLHRGMDAGSSLLVAFSFFFFFFFTREEGRLLSSGLVHDVKTFSSWAVAANYAGDDVVVSLRGWFVMAVLSLSVGAVRDQHIPGPDLHMGEKGWIGIIFYFIFSFFRGYIFLFFF